MISNEQPHRERRIRLPRHPRAAGEARWFVDRLLGHRVSERVRDSARLVSSELVANAYRHGEGEIELRVELLDDRLRIEVIDEGHGQTPAVREQGGDETGDGGFRSSTGSPCGGGCSKEHSRVGRSRSGLSFPAVA